MLHLQEVQLKLSMLQLQNRWQQNVLNDFESCDIAILSAAVADFTPEEVKDKKIKKDGNDLLLRLKPTTDIAGLLGKIKETFSDSGRFALETDNEIKNAKEKLIRKNLDIIVLNSLREWCRFWT